MLFICIYLITIFEVISLCMYKTHRLLVQIDSFLVNLNLVRLKLLCNAKTSVCFPMKFIALQTVLSSEKWKLNEVNGKPVRRKFCTLHDEERTNLKMHGCSSGQLWKQSGYSHTSLVENVQDCFPMPFSSCPEASMRYNYLIFAYIYLFRHLD